LGESQQTKAQANFLQLWAFVTVTFLVTLILIFYPLQGTTKSQRLESSTNSRGTLSKHKKGGFIYLFIFIF
jgi:hypothetical protein